MSQTIENLGPQISKLAQIRQPTANLAKYLQFWQRDQTLARFIFVQMDIMLPCRANGG